MNNQKIIDDLGVTKIKTYALSFSIINNNQYTYFGESHILNYSKAILTSKPCELICNAAFEELLMVNQRSYDGAVNKDMVIAFINY